MPSLDEIRASIDARLAEAHSEITSLEAARAALHDEHVTPRPTTTRRPVGRTPAAPQSKAPPPVKAAQTRPAADGALADAVPSPSSKPSAPLRPSMPLAPAAGKPRPRAPRTAAKRRISVSVLSAGKLEAMLGETEEGLSATAIAKAAGARDGQVRELLSDRERAGEIRRTGAGRGTRWRLITDEERIAARAAELEQARAGAS